MKNRLPAIVFLLTLPAAAAALGTELYVATTGDDANPGTKKQPFATLARARDAVRANPPIATDPITVYVRGGVYYLARPLLLEPEDSGTPDRPVTYAAYQDEKPTISGGVMIDAHWERHRGRVMKCKVPGGMTFGQLFVNGERRMRARYPNFDPQRPLMGDGGYTNATGGSNEIGNGEFYFDPRTFTRRRWANPETAVVHIFASHYWHNAQYRIKQIDYDRHAVILGEGGWQTHEYMAGNSFAGNSRFFIDNVIEELDAPNEWFLDSQNGMLYFLPPEGLELAGATIEVPQLKRLIEFRGTQENPVRHIKLAGFRFTHTAATYLGKYEVPSTGDWGIHRGGALFFEGAENCSVKNCFFDSVGGNALFISNHNQRIRVDGNKFAYTGDSAVCICGENNMVDKEWACEFCGTSRPWDFAEVEEYPSECLITNNVMHHIGVYGKQTAGVFMSMTRHNTVSHNHIHDMPRSAICINDPFWGGHVIEHNDIHDTVLESDDHGPFNSWGRGHFWCLGVNRVAASHEAGDVKRDSRFRTVVRSNRFRDASNYGIVMDDGTARFHVYNNLCIGVGLQNREGDYRIVENNIFINPAHGIGFDVGHEQNHDQFLRNIVVINADYGVWSGKEGNTAFKEANAAAGEQYFYRVVYPPVKGKWIDEIDYNVLFNQGGLFEWRFTPHPQGNEFEPGDSWEDWRAMGYDGHSVMADPLFVDPGRGDFRVKPQSPARKLGFQNFSTDRFGLLPDYSNPWGK